MSQYRMRPVWLLHIDAIFGRISTGEYTTPAACRPRDIKKPGSNSLAFSKWFDQCFMASKLIVLTVLTQAPNYFFATALMGREIFTLKQENLVFSWRGSTGGIIRVPDKCIHSRDRRFLPGQESRPNAHVGGIVCVNQNLYSLCKVS